ncbi:hypothetical protein [Azospirillum doebereinerae]
MGHMVIGPDDSLSLPKALRDQIGLKPGDPVRVEVDPLGSVTLSEGAGVAGGAESLRSQNIMIDGQRISLRLEHSIWDALEDIGRREKLSLNQLCTAIKTRADEQARQRGQSPEEGMMLSSAARLFVVSYYRHAVTKAETRRPDHGNDLFAGTPFAQPLPAPASENRPSPRKSIDALIGIGGTFHRAVSSEEMDDAVHKRAAARFLGK